MFESQFYGLHVHFIQIVKTCYIWNKLVALYGLPASKFSILQLCFSTFKLFFILKRIIIFPLRDHFCFCKCKQQRPAIDESTLWESASESALNHPSDQQKYTECKDRRVTYTYITHSRHSIIILKLYTNNTVMKIIIPKGTTSLH